MFFLHTLNLGLERLELITKYVLVLGIIGISIGLIKHGWCATQLVLNLLFTHGRSMLVLWHVFMSVAVHR